MGRLRGGLREILIQSLQQRFTSIDLLSLSCRICGIACLKSERKAALATREIQEQQEETSRRFAVITAPGQPPLKPAVHPGLRSTVLNPLMWSVIYLLAPS